MNECGFAEILVLQEAKHHSVVRQPTGFSSLSKMDTKFVSGQNREHGTGSQKQKSIIQRRCHMILVTALVSKLFPIFNLRDQNL